MATLPLAPGACGQPPMPPYRRRSVACPPARRRTRWPSRGRACRGSGRRRACRRRPRGSCSNSVLHLQRVGIAHGVGQADTVDAGVERRAHQAQHLAGSTRPWIVQPKAVDRPTSTRQSEPWRRAARRCGAGPRTTSSGVRFADWPGCARGWPTAAAASRARPTRSRARRPSGWAPAPRLAGPAGSWQRPPARRCRPAAASAWPARTSRPRSRAGRRRGRRESTRACARWAARAAGSAGRRAGRPRARSRVGDSVHGGTVAMP